MNKIPRKITQSLMTNYNVCVFTQNLSVINNFLLEEPGRWNISIDKRVWGNPVSGERVIEGNASIGFKIGLQDPNKSGHIIDVDKRITFSKNPFDNIQHDYIIKDWLSFPEIKLEVHLPPIIAINTIKDPICIIPDNLYSYYALHDQLTIQKIDHSLDTSGEEKKIHLMKHPRYIEGYKTAIIYGFKPIEYLIPFHNFDTIIIVRPKELTGNFNYSLIKAITHCFNETPYCALSPDYINFKTFQNPHSIEKNMILMEMAGFLKRSRVDNQSVIIHKRGEMPDDIEFHAIPDGQYTLSSLANYMKIPREEVFPILKKWEGKGLIFSYTSQSQPKLWKLLKEPDEGTMRALMDYFHEDKILLNEMTRIGEMALNQYLEEKIQTHCLTTGAKAVCFLQDQAEHEINCNTISMKMADQGLRSEETS